MRRHSKSIWTNTIFSFAFPVLTGIASMFLSSLIFSALAFFIFRSMVFDKIFTVMSLVLGGIVSGRLCGLYRRRYGLLDGIICGGLLYAVLLITGIAAGEFTDIKKLLLLVVSGAIGGVMGVNSERPRNLM